METTTVSAFYDDLSQARDAVQALVESGVPREKISLVASDAAGEYSGTAADVQEIIQSSAPAELAATGAVVGGLGGLLIGMAVLAIPGIGPVLAAGSITNAIIGGVVGAGAGAAVGGLMGGLINMGISREAASQYAEGVRRGGAVVITQLDDPAQVTAVQAVLDRYNPVNLSERVADWQDQGWQDHDPEASPYTIEDIQRERQRYRGVHDPSRDRTGE
jgi:hypothetical protein